jgi:hypothetical protein
MPAAVGYSGFNHNNWMNNMNWDAIGAFAELLAATGGIVAIVYLALQLRQNTHALDRSERAARAATSFQGALTWAEINIQAAQDADLAEAVVASFEADSPTFTKQQTAQLHFFGRSTMERLDALHYLFRHEQLEEELWNVRVTWARRVVDCPYWRSWWQTEREASNYSPSFILELEREPSDGGVT